MVSDVIRCEQDEWFSDVLGMMALLCCWGFFCCLFCFVLSHIQNQEPRISHI